MEKTYNPKDVEERLYKEWEGKGYFKPEINPNGKPFSIMLPPPNVTGTLHMGHAFEDTLQDILVRYHRMKGDKTLWLPGTDHAAIATQAKVEGILYKEEEKTRHDVGREEFLRRVEEFAQQSHDTIVNQMKRIGSSVDWEREAYTFDEARNLAVRTAFKHMFDSGLIYKAAYIVNWDPKLQTTVSDDEIEWKQESTPLYYLQYGPFVIGTARPETKFGDKYVVMHPNDKRYIDYKDGQILEAEWINGKVTATVIKDTTVDMKFGTGVMTITPWHDRIDFEIAQKHNLDKEQIIDAKGLLLPIAEEFSGMHIKKARPQIVEKLKEKNLLVKIDENYTHRLATNSRGGGIIEPQIKEQWFVAVNKEFPMPDSNIKGLKKGDSVTLKKLMRHVVESGQITITPEHFVKTYYHWIDNLRDWNISRQIWFGHRIPVWYRTWNEKPNDLYVMGFHERTVSQVYSGKSETYRLRDHGVQVGDRFALENSQTKEILGYGTIVHIQKTTVDKTPLQNRAHGALYETVDQLIEAFQFHHKDKNVTKETPVWIYTYSFAPAADTIQERYVGIEPPEGEGWEQDPDTLDTWFSSGLWTFSTLGWPKETSDLKTFHPTSVIIPGYEILFFWVARMVLMSGFLLGDIPFHKVYLHGIVRDKQGRKFSKSLNNGIDPLEMIEKYGTDALRIALIFSAAPGNDVMFDEDKVRGMKFFANKLWNMARFIEMKRETLRHPERSEGSHVTQYSASEDYSSGLNRSQNDIQELINLATHENDKAMIEKTKQLASDVEKAIETFRLHDAAQKLYDFAWHEFADVYIEDVKNRLDDNSYLILTTLYLILLKLLHPFMPFITEEIYQKMGNNDSLMISSWPKA